MSKIGLYLGESNFTGVDESDYFINIAYKNIKYFYALDANIFDIILLDKCIQKLENFYAIFDNSRRLLKNGGELIIAVPDYRLYEKCYWPSRLNSEHVHSFSININKEIVSRETHWNIEEDLVPLLKKFNFMFNDVILDDNNFDYDKPVLIDQTKFGASCYIIVRCTLNKE